MASRQGFTERRRERSARGSIDGVGWRFQSFGINELEMVDLRFVGWNPLVAWLKAIDLVRDTHEAR